MPSMTDYIVLNAEVFEVDGKFNSGPPDIKTLAVTLPDDFTSGTNLARPLLAFIVNFVSDDGSMGIWVNPEFPLLQTTRLQTLTWNNAHHSDSGLWVAIPGTMFKPGQANQIVFAMQPGDDGRVRFRDVVLWFQRD